MNKCFVSSYIAALVVILGCVQLSLASSDNCKDFNKWLRETMEGNQDEEAAFKAASGSSYIQGNEKFKYAFRIWKELREAKDKSIEDQVELASIAASFVLPKVCNVGYYEKFVSTLAANIFKQPEAIQELLKPVSDETKEMINDLFTDEALRKHFKKENIKHLDGYQEEPANQIYTFNFMGHLIVPALRKLGIKPSMILKDDVKSAEAVIKLELLTPCKEYNKYLLEPMNLVTEVDDGYAGQADEGFKFPYFIHNVCMMARARPLEFAKGLRNFFTTIAYN